MTITEIRKKLKEKYDEFFQLFGPLNKASNRRVILRDPSGFVVLSSLEVKHGHNDFRPSDILIKSRKGQVETIVTDNCMEALSWVLGVHGRVDIGMIAELVSKDEQEVLDELGDNIYINPGTGGWETSDKWLSGNVHTKLIMCENICRENDNEQYKRSWKAIQEVQPEQISWELLGDGSLNLGERWINVEIYNRFINWLFKMEPSRGYKLHYFPAVDQYKIDHPYYSQVASSEYMVRSKGRTTLYGYDLMEYALMNTTPRITYSEGYGGNAQVLVDVDATQLANDKIETIRQEFVNWLQIQSDDDKQLLVDTYNNLYNCYVLRKYNGDHLQLPGLDTSKLGKDETPITVRKAQKDAIWRGLQQVGGIDDWQVGSGKAQPLDAKLLTPTGWKKMGDIQVGDYVISVDGKPTKVLGVFPQGEKEIYNICMNDGSNTECCEDHLWNVNDTGRAYKKLPWLTLSVKQMLNETEQLHLQKYGKRCKEGTIQRKDTYYKINNAGKRIKPKWMIPMMEPVEFEEQETYIDPYIMGSLIGDGSLSHGSVNITSADPEIVENIWSLLPDNYQIRKKLSGKYEYSITMINRKGKLNKFVAEIERLGLNKLSQYKFIPNIYKFNSIKNRIAILQGLMDTDGSCEVTPKNTVTSRSTFSTVSMQLCDDVVFLVQSLGGVARVSTKIPHYTHKNEYRSGQLAYVINISLPPEIIPFRLKRKVDRHIPRSKYKPNRFITNIEYVGKKEAQCILVDHPTHLYVTDDCIVTHNTLIMVITSYEMKRMKIRNKPCILALKANVAEIAKTYRLAYPGAKVLFPSEQDFEKKNRKRLFHEIKNNDWDCVIMTHDQFGKIPQSDEIQQEILQDEIDNLDRDLNSMHGTISRTMRKGLEQRRSSLNVKLKTIKARIEKGKDDITFDEMSIDHLFIDESQKYKNLTYTTRHERVAGLGNTEGSQKALNMLFAIRTLQKRFDSDLQATFLSGTVISNSLTELYLLFKYLRPKELEKQNILNFDAWAAVYAKKTIDFEFSVTNQIQSKERFRHFIKVPELAVFYNEIADYQTNDTIGIDKPEMVEELIHLPPTEDQQEFIQKLISYAGTGIGAFIGRPELVPGGPGDSARMLIATNYAKKMSTDMRLIDAYLYDDNPGNKISVCCEKVAETYRKSASDKGTQLIFCDLGTPDKEKWNVYYELRKKLTEEYEIPVAEIAFIHDYNERTRQKLFKQVNDGDVRILIGSTDKAGTGVNVQQRVLTVHDLDIPWKPAELEQRGGRGARQGNWLAKLVQDNKVFRYIYAVEKSLDTYKFTLLKNKQAFISQMKNSELQVRSIDEGSFDEATGMNFAEYVAVLSGDTTLLEKAKIDKRLAMLENLRTVHYREQSKNETILNHKRDRLPKVLEMVESVGRDDRQFNSSMVTNDKGASRENPIEIFALKEQVQDIVNAWSLYEIRRQERKLMRKCHMDVSEVEIKTPKEVSTVIGEHIIKMLREWKPKANEEREVIGKLYGFNCCIERHKDSAECTGVGSNIMFSNRFYVQHPDGGLRYYFNSGVPSRSNEKLAGRIFLLSLDRVANILKGFQEELEEVQRTIAALESIEKKPFARDEEIVQLRKDSKKLEHEIQEKITGKVHTPTQQVEGHWAEADEVKEEVEVEEEEEDVPWNL